MNDMTPVQFRQIRLDLKLSQDELALLLGVARGTVTRYESGFRRISDTVAKLLERISERQRL